MNARMPNTEMHVYKNIKNTSIHKCRNESGMTKDYL
jgi:hypothetical protein